MVLKFLDNAQKTTFRRIESIEKKIRSTEFHQEFNKICLKENLHPNYTHIYIYILRGVSSSGYRIILKVFSCETVSFPVVQKVKSCVQFLKRSLVKNMAGCAMLILKGKILPC